LLFLETTHFFPKITFSEIGGDNHGELPARRLRQQV
jgi:hypothetical protein